jgi:hypothetical protein
MANAETNPNDKAEKAPPSQASFWSFGLGHSFVVRHSSFVILTKPSAMFMSLSA